MRCLKIVRSVLFALGLGVSFAAAQQQTYTANITYEGGTYYYSVVGGRSDVNCQKSNGTISLTASSMDSRTFTFYSDKNCKTLLATATGTELFGTEKTVTATLSADGTLTKSAAAAPGVKSSSSTAKSSSSSRWPTATSSSSSKETQPQKAGGKTIAFYTPWTNTSAILYMDGDSTATMIKMDKYCGWFTAKANPTANGLKVYFKQTIGLNYVGAEGMTTVEPTIATEISLDSVAALSDTIWVQGFKTDVPAIYSKYPGVLGDCPLKKFPVTVFDWLHGSNGDGGGEGQNGDPANGVSADFGSGGCNSVKGMVQYKLGPNGVPVPSVPFPEKCLRSDHLASWFLPEVLGKDSKGVEYTNMTCRDLYISMDNEGFWLAEVSKDRISEGNEKNRGGMFLLDDFEYLDDAKTVKNPYFDWLSGGSDNGRHNFGFTMKIQAQFEYVPGQYFDFLGDDDVWVFIDNRLAVDIGGQHAQERGAVLLDTMGLTPGETYDFHIFYVERHQSSSNFRMRTSIDLQVDAAILIDSDKRNDATLYMVSQINKKNKLSCGFDPNNTEVDTTAGPSTFKLTGGNLDADSILDVGTYFEGLVIIDDHTFSIDTAKIVEKTALPPGHYFLEVTLKSDPSQTTKIEFVIPSYAIPSISFATDSWKLLGREVSGDTLQIGDWAYATYQVNITFLEEWAQVSGYNKRVNLSFNNPNIDILDSTGKKITYVNLDENARATFFIHPNAAVSGVTLIAKGSSPTASLWTNLNFKDPPIPHVKNAIIVDRNGDGRADSLFVSYDRSLKDKSSLDSIQFSFGESFETTTSYKILGNGTDLVITAENMNKKCSEESCGFGTKQFTGGAESVFEGKLNSWFTYTENSKSTRFNTEGDPIADGIGPIVLSAVKKKLKDGNRELTITLSEAITDESRENYLNLFEFTCMRQGEQNTPENPSQVSGSGNTVVLIYSPSKLDAVVPDNGDQVRLLFENVVTEDLSGNKPHKNNPWVTVSGDQEISNEAPGVILISASDTTNPILSSKETTQPILITDPNLSAQAVGEQLGTQGNLVDVNFTEIMREETKKDINALDAFIESLLGSETSYDTLITGMTEEQALDQLFKDIEAGLVGDAYGISEETVAAVQNGTITKENFKSSMSKDEVAAVNKLVQESVEADRDTIITIGSISSTTQQDIFDAIRNGDYDKELKKAGVSANTIAAIKNGDLNESNIEDFRSGASSLVADTAIVLHYQTRYYSQFGEYVGGTSRTIKCADEDVYGTGGCQLNPGKLFLAWNMRADDGRFVGTGVYIARLQMKVKVNGKVVQDQTRDKLMGVRRGK